MRRAAMLLATAWLAACAGGPTAPERIESAKVTLAAAPVCCTQLAQAVRKALPVDGSVIVIDEQSQVYQFDDGKAYFVLFELPPFTSPYRMVATSQAAGGPAGMSMLMLRIAVFDAEFKPTRVFTETELRHRGMNAEHTVFMNPSNAGERYVAFYGSNASGPIAREQISVTSTPVFVGRGFFNLVSGQEGKVLLLPTPVGRLRLEVQPLALPTAR